MLHLCALLPLSDEGGELLTNHQISYLHGGAISPCLSTPHLLHYSLQSHLNRQMTLWDIQCKRNGKTGKKGRRRESRTMNSMIIAWLNKRWITHRSVHLSLCMMIQNIYRHKLDIYYIPSHTST